jgi:hypothetical protein
LERREGGPGGAGLPFAALCERPLLIRECPSWFGLCVAKQPELLGHVNKLATPGSHASEDGWPLFPGSSNVSDMARARQIPDVTPRDSYGSVAAKAVAVRAEEVFARHQQVLAVEDIEALHDMRVATRRLRAALEVFEPCFPRHPFRRALKDVKRLADALGERRDRDVQIEALERYAGARDGEERAAVLGFVDRLREEQAAANSALAQTLEEAQGSDLHGRLQELAALAITGRQGDSQARGSSARSKHARQRRSHDGDGAGAGGSGAALAARRRR